MENTQPTISTPPVPPPVRLPAAPKAERRQRPPRVLPKRKPARQRQAAAPRAVRRELSAGGVVVRQEGNTYFVALLKTEHKRGLVWVLPKGHVELQTKERISDAAKREVQEEAGITDLSVQNQLGVTRFAFQAEDALVKKTVHYFLMFTGQIKLVPQLEEGLIEAAWFPLADAVKALEYDTDQDMVRRAQERILGITSSPKKQSPRTLRIHT